MEREVRKRVERVIGFLQERKEVEEVRLFGSARRSKDPADIDLAIVLEGEPFSCFGTRNISVELVGETKEREELRSALRRMDVGVEAHMFTGGDLRVMRKNGLPMVGGVAITLGWVGEEQGEGCVWFAPMDYVNKLGGERGTRLLYRRKGGRR